MKNGDLQSGYVKRGQIFFLLSFIGLIVLGTVMLWITSTWDEDPMQPVDALFMATSSVCVTGLTVKSVAGLNLAGQTVILLLIQAGGLGIMTLSASILLALGNGLSFGESLMISNLNDKFSLRGTETLLKTVIIYTFAMEGAGFLALLPGMWLSDGIGFWKGLWGGAGFWEGVWDALFMSVSSFCNAGMTPFPDSLVGKGRYIQMVCALLAITGGLGIYVIYDVLQVARRRQNRLRVHSKLVLTTTATLLLAGTAGLWISGWAAANDLSWFDAFFFAVTSRTCGWYTSHVAELPPVSLTLIMVMMLIGGSPGSTAGGIKTSTVALALAAIVGTLRGDPETMVFKRRIPAINVLRAFTIILIFTIMGCIGALILETREQHLNLSHTAFEAVSALTTTGLSVGDTTARLSGSSKLLLVLYMFCGRVGPFTLLLFLMGREKPGRLKYPEERVIIG